MSGLVRSIPMSLADALQLKKGLVLVCGPEATTAVKDTLLQSTASGVVMMGERRHRDEAVASVELALEGILVIAALPVRMAAEGFGRLISLGADARAVAAACVRSLFPRGRDLWEELVVTDWIRRLIAGGADAEVIHRYAVINERWQLAY